MKQLLAAVAMTASLALPAMAAEPDAYMINNAGDLVNLCDDPSNQSAIHMCHGYLMGVHHMYVGIAESHEVDIYCIPRDTEMTRDEFVAQFVVWADAKPEVAQVSARDALLTFAGEVFPCSQ